MTKNQTDFEDVDVPSKTPNWQGSYTKQMELNLEAIKDAVDECHVDIQEKIDRLIETQEKR